MMHNNFVPLELTYKLSEFLQPDGLALSAGVLKEQVGRAVNTLSENQEFKLSDINWLSQEISEYLSWKWIGDRAELDGIRLLQDRLMDGGLDVANELLGVLIEKVTQMGEYFYSKMVDFDNGTPEDSYGNNRLFQGSRLQECILLGVRLGMDIEILEKWKAKLGEDKRAELIKSIYPKRDMPKQN